MAHRRALVRRWGWVPWLLVPLVLTLDGVTALTLAGYRWPLGLAVPEAILIAAPLLAYGALAFLAFRNRPVSVRLVAAGVLLALHAGLVATHTLVFASLWSLPVPAALRLAHRWSPLIPLLQLVWVPLLALPFARLAQAPTPAASRRSGSAPARRDVLASRGTQSGQRGRPEPDRDLAGEPSAHAIAPVATVETMPGALPEPVAVAVPAVPPTVVSAVSVVEAPSATLPFAAVAEPEPPATVPTPTMVVVHDLELAEPVRTSADAAPVSAEPAVAEPVAAGNQAEVEPMAAPAAVPVPSVDHAVLPVEQEPPPVNLPAAPVTVASIDAVVVLTGDTREPEDLHAAESRHIPEMAPVTVPLALLPVPSSSPSPTPPVVPAEPPLDLYIVARLFEPYGPLLSRDGAVLVDWVPRPDAGIVCVSPREVPRERMVNLAGRLARALTVAGRPPASTPVRRLSLRSPDGVAVLTPLDRGILVVAARRPGAAALLEVLSARVVPGPLGVEVSGAGSDDALAAREFRVSDAVRVETLAATLEVLTPSAVDAEPLGELAGRLLHAIAEDPDDRTRHTLGLDLGSHWLVVHPVHPSVRPPRFVAVVGGREAPGLLWRRAERAARELRAAS